MIGTPTVLVLGAGASIEYGFPSGPALRREIVAALKTPTDDPDSLFGLLCQLRFRPDELREFAEKLEDSGLPSADIFLERRPEWAQLGKAAIGATLVRYEDEDKLRDRSGETRWYEHLWDRLVADADGRVFAQNELSIVTFNYDRSLEAFLHRAMTTTYGMQGADLWAKRTVPIVHVHGSLGVYDPGTREHRDYRMSTDPQTIRAVADSINLVSDPNAADVLEQANELVRSAGRVCFLGFGYHEANLDKLTGLRTSEKHIRGTTKNVGVGIRALVIRRLKKSRGHRGQHAVDLDDGSLGVLRYLEHAGILA